MAGLPKTLEEYTSFRVYFTTCIFGISLYVSMNSIWTQLPFLTRVMPEGTGLSTYLVILFECGNIAPMAYLISQRCSSKKMDEVPYICIIITISFVSLVLIGAFWDHTNQIVHNEHSIVFLLCVAALGLVGSLAPVVYFSFITRLKKQYVTALLAGEGIGLLLPQIITVTQGYNYACPEPEMAIPTMNLTESKQSAYKTLTTTLAPQPLFKLRFDIPTYFYITSCSILFTGIAFILIRYAPLFSYEYVDGPPDGPSNFEHNRPSERNVHVLGWEYPDRLIVLDDGTVRHPFQYASTGLIANQAASQSQPCVNHISHSSTFPRANHVTNRPMNKSAECVVETEYVSSRLQKEPTSHDSYSDDSDSQFSLQTTEGSEQIIGNDVRGQGQDVYARVDTTNPPRRQQPPQQSRSQRLSVRNDSDENELKDGSRSYCLLMAITLWTSLIIYGPLSSPKSFACLPMGNNVFTVAVLLVGSSMILCALLAVKLANSQQMTIIIAFTTLGTILLTYFAALVTFSFYTESRGTSPLFGNTGELLAAVAWVAIVGLFSFVRVCAAVKCRTLGREAMQWFAFMLQLGNVLGSFCMLHNINICQIFNAYGNECEKKDSDP